MAKRVDLVYGRSGSMKSTWIIKLAEWFWAKKGLKTRVYLGDGGYETYEGSGLVEEGIIEVMQYNLWDHPLETSQRICEGWWPKDPSIPGSPLQKVDLVELAKTHGMLAYEGLTVMSDYISGDREGGLSNQAGKSTRKLKTNPTAGKDLGGGLESPYAITDGDLTFGNVSESGVGFVQRRIMQLIEASRAFPGWVQWTAHERLAEDRDTSVKEFGPDVIGKALTTKIGGSFGNTIHLHRVGKKKSVRDKITGKEVDELLVTHRAYTRTHYDPDQQSFVKYFANSRMPPEQASMMPEFIEPPDPIRFYNILEKAKQDQKKVREERATVLVGEPR